MDDKLMIEKLMLAIGDIFADERVTKHSCETHFVLHDVEGKIIEAAKTIQSNEKHNAASLVQLQHEEHSIKKKKNETRR